METQFHHRRRVEFAETDMAGIAHFTNFFRYMEEAEHAFLRSRGLSVVLEDDKGKLGFPKLSVDCDYKRPTRYDDQIEVHMVIRCTDGKSILYECTLTRDDECLATGKLRVAFCRFPTDGPPFAVPISDEVLEKLFGES